MKDGHDKENNKNWVEDKGQGFFMCLKDGFVTNSQKGMNIHKARIHPDIEDLFQ